MILPVVGGFFKKKGLGGKCGLLTIFITYIGGKTLVTEAFLSWDFFFLCNFAAYKTAIYGNYKTTENISSHSEGIERYLSKTDKRYAWCSRVSKCSAH